MPGVRAARRGGAAAWAWAALAMMVGAAAPVARGEVGAHELWGFGRNSQGQLGVVDLADHTTPVVLSVLKGKTVLSAAGGGSESNMKWCRTSGWMRYSVISTRSSCERCT